MDNLRVLMLCKAFPPITGGVESYSLQVAAAYRRAGAAVTVITQTTGRSGWRELDVNNGQIIKIFNTGKGGQLATAVKMLARYLVARLQDDFTFVHATTWRPGIVTLVIRGIPLVVSAHGRELFRIPRVLRPLMHSVFKRASRVISVSSATLSRAIHAGIAPEDTGSTRRKWMVVGNGLTYTKDQVDARSVKVGSPLGEVSILTVARLVERKNIAACIMALAEVHRSGTTTFKYRIAGNGPLLRSLRELAASTGLGDKIEALGFVDDAALEQLYRNCDIFLHPQIDTDGGDDYEGFGISIADAMAFGAAVVAGDGSGPSDFVIDGVTGFLVDGRNRSQLTTRIKNLIEDSELRGRLGHAAQQHVLSQLSWDRHVRSILDSLTHNALR